MKSIAGWVDSVGRRFRSTADREGGARDGETTRGDEPRASLFRCHDCETVYIATDKATCSPCDANVDRIPSTPTGTL